jgi:hypothetical protein
MLVVRLLRATRRRRLYWPATMALERAGERYGIDWLVDNPLVFAFWHERAVESAPLVVDAIERAFPHAHTYADIGAGTGALAAELQRRTKVVIAYERSRWGRLIARSQRVDVRDLQLERLSLSDLAPVDVACAASAPAVVFTAAAPGEGGTGHVNEQPKRYWIERFQRAGMHLDTGLTEMLVQGFAGATTAWLVQHVMVFVATD